MKLSLNIGGRAIAVGMGLVFILTSAPLIRANGDDILDAKQTANLSVLARAERAVAINSKTPDNPLPEDRGPEQKNGNKEGSQHGTGLSS